MKIAKFLTLICVLSSLFVVSCKKQPHFSVEGIVKDAKGETLFLGRRGIADVFIVDSAKIADDGTFSIKSEAPQNPDLYVLRLGNQSINLSVDSIETITLEATKNNFSTDYIVTGSEGSSRMREVVLAQADLSNNISDSKNKFQNNLISDDVYLTNVRNSLSTYKDEVKKIIISDLKSPAAYFALFQKVEGILIFDPYQKDDSKIYSAVATSWDFHYKDTPRAKHLKDFTLRSISERRLAENQKNAFENLPRTETTDYYNIELKNVRGQLQSLSSLKGKVVLLDFTVYEGEHSPLHNMELNKVYEKYKDNFEIYQVSFDSDVHLWQNAASNLPWISVRDEASVTSGLIHKFNLQELPTAFLLSRQGELIKRLSLDDNVESEVKKLL